MTTRLLKLWDTLRSSLWFVPAVMTIAAIALSFATVELDRRLADDVERALGIAYQGGPEGARAVLSAIAGSMITVAGVTFSITIVALTLASQQYGPRLLRTFLRDVGNQVVLGTFVATFVYCLLVLRTIRGGDAHRFVPQLSVSGGIALAIASLGILIYFIHHVAESIQAPHVIAAVSGELLGTIERLFPERIGNEPEDEASQAAALPRDGRPVALTRIGYVEALDGDGLVNAAQRRGVVVHLACRPGDFVHDGMVGAVVVPADRVEEGLDDEIRAAVLVGAGRTTFQDMGFAIDQLVEIALRAMSPAINDPFTAASCIDHLGAALSRLAGRIEPSPFRAADGTVRVVVRPFGFAEALDRAFGQIGRAAAGRPEVVRHLLGALGAIAGACRRRADLDAVRRRVASVERAAFAVLTDVHERERIRDLAAQADRTAAAAAEGG